MRKKNRNDKKREIPRKKEIRDNYDVDHMNAHICINGTIGYCYPCSLCKR
jgi:hypothetical protein